MAIAMHQVSVPVFVRHLKGMADCMKKAQALYGEKKYDESTLLGYRFYPRHVQLRQAGSGGHRPCAHLHRVCWRVWKRRSSRTTRRASPS